MIKEGTAAVFYINNFTKIQHLSLTLTGNQQNRSHFNRTTSRD